MISPGQQLGPYKVEKLLGEGATASVFLATDPKLRRLVAVKVLKEDLGPASRERFEREVRLTLGRSVVGGVSRHDLDNILSGVKFIHRHR